MSAIDADVAVLGSGFAGSLCALILDRLGLRPVVIDAAVHPRFAIGESSTPIADMILRDLADTYDLPRLRPLSAYGPWQETYPHLVAGRKRGFSYFNHEPGHPFVPTPDHANELLVAASSSDYASDTHWFRADVDAFFAECVRDAGIPLYEGTRIYEVKAEDGWLLRARCAETERRITAPFVIDATGATGVVPRSLGLLPEVTGLYTHSRTLYSHFAGVPRFHDFLTERGGRVGDHPFPCDAAALHHVLDGAWLWLLRFNNDVVSAGLVLDSRRHPLNPDVSPEAEWKSWLQRYPTLREQFADVRLLDPPGALVRTGRLQRRFARVAGPAWALLPHTAGFIDPLHSMGIAHSLCGVERLMHAVDNHWQGPGWEAALQAYDRSVRRELVVMDRLVDACYAALPSFRLFVASTMLYFAAVVTYENARGERPDEKRHAPFNRLFLCADDEALSSLIREAHTRLRTPAAGALDAEAFESFVERGIRPYNTAGLLHPRIPNMYHHTAAPRASRV